MTSASRNRICVMYGDDPGEMVPVLLDALDVARRIPTEASVGIKPNLVVARPSEQGATTDPRIVGAIIAYLQSHGIRHITVMESAWVGDSTTAAFDVCGYRALSEVYGVPLIDLKDAPTIRRRADGLAIDIARPALDVDYLINVPVLKVHSQATLTVALKNLKGVIPDMEKQRFHTLGLHRPIAALASIVRSDLIVVDGIVGDLSHEEGGNPVRMNRLFAGTDPVLIDTYAASLLGYRAADISYIYRAEKLGVGSSDLSGAEVRTLNTPQDASIALLATPAAERFARYIDARDACSPCYGGLIHALMRLERAGKLPLKQTLSIGQGFKNTPLACGIGSCTKDGACYVKGCPPTAEQIVRFLEGAGSSNVSPPEE